MIETSVVGDGHFTFRIYHCLAFVGIKVIRLRV